VTALQSWNDTETRQAIERFVEGPAQDVPPEERVAVFDNDGTLGARVGRRAAAARPP
jgi:hypothetical protein